MNWEGWSAWVSLDAAQPPAGPGVYVVACARALPRVGGDDPDGILDIGESSSLGARLRAFRRCATTPGAKGHMAGWRLRVTALASHLQLGTLRVRWRVYDGKEGAYRGEGDLLGAYLREFGELPPLNYKFNWEGNEGSWRRSD